jgi:hypothetical protein
MDGAALGASLAGLRVHLLGAIASLDDTCLRLEAQVEIAGRELKEVHRKLEGMWRMLRLVEATQQALRESGLADSALEQHGGGRAAAHTLIHQSSSQLRYFLPLLQQPAGPPLLLLLQLLLPSLPGHPSSRGFSR